MSLGVIFREESNGDVSDLQNSLEVCDFESISTVYTRSGIHTDLYTRSGMLFGLALRAIMTPVFSMLKP